ncbi:MAG: type VI secretion system tube protein Hcp [Ectothiorhodospiraceae bacterium]|nr:type VI secretion system tube protein Hcp [Ectothiorhodospiraceae bacterium]
MSILMEYGSIQGETTDTSHSGWLDIEEINFDGVKRRITSKASTSHDRESANSEFSEIVLIRHMDKASPGLFLEACQGRGKELILHLTKTSSTGAGADTYLQYVLKNAIISGYEVMASRYSRCRPAEQLTVSFTCMELRYTPYDDEGKALAPVAVGYDPTTHMLA